MKLYARPLLAALALSVTAAGIAFANADVSVNIADDGLAKSISVTDKSVRKQGPISRATVQLTNSSKKPMNIQYLAEWRNEYNEPVDTGARWEEITVDGSATRVISLTGRRPQAISVYFTIKPTK